MQIKKNLIIVGVGLILAAISMCPLSAHAANGVRVIMDNIPVTFTYESGVPFIDGEYRTQVPLRETMEAFGAIVSWDQENQVATVEKDGITVMVPISANYIIKDGDIIMTDTSAEVSNSRTYLPIRAVAEAFGANVKWNQAARAVVISPFTDKNMLALHFLDVGQGDSIFIDFGEYEILIDGGSNEQGQKVVDDIGPFIDGNLELIIATHVHADHLGGLDDVIYAFQVDKIIHSGDTYNTKNFNNYLVAANAEPNCEYIADSDMVIDLGSGVTLNIMDIIDGDANYNNNSVISRLDYNAIKVLLMGDAEVFVENAGLHLFSDIDVLKVGHHGSYTSSSKDFLATVRPEYGIISAGLNNPYRHPHLSVLNNFREVETTLFKTFEKGNIVMVTDGETYSFKFSNVLE